MRYVATPEFSEKVSTLDSEELQSLASVLERLKDGSRSALEKELTSLSGLEGNLHVIKQGDLRVFLSFGSNKDGEYALLVDLAVRQNSRTGHSAAGFRAVSPNLDPRKNRMINPRQNSIIDPKRNMMIDPNRNMIIDPRRNTMIDPRRNMMIDPNRNMMIDPLRNSMLDPNKNSLINPARNSAWNGAFLYNLDARPEGFFVRAGEKVSLQFDPDANFVGFCVPAGDNFNMFNPNGRWVAFFAKSGANGYNQFDTSCNWIGFTTKSLLPRQDD
ncbi:hypothetical protein SAMN04488020_103217 [Palleronia marisminoris]|uniref:Uncharacterized protein n=1 Tax=Palleronia marisminoris TaxID=315423 RepID=A0A1Y5S9K7_9RHOB|nr:hypothetical protein [Palleronia marisminoris]SFG69586.1 hypothetical protein SAMN04488020_103217 [Palleronia marisminoris]SLN35674.1 hypothetical protein PAM7066_01496 [Palleronia marisminoris]